MLSIELDQLQEEVQSRVQALRKQTIELSSDVQALSHDLHSSGNSDIVVAEGESAFPSACHSFRSPLAVKGALRRAQKAARP